MQKILTALLGLLLLVSLGTNAWLWNESKAAKADEDAFRGKLADLEVSYEKIKTQIRKRASPRHQNHFLLLFAPRLDAKKSH